MPTATTKNYVFCCGMLRSGSTLQYQIALELLGEAAISCGFLEREQISDFLTENPPLPGKTIVVKSHCYHPDIRALVERGEAMVFYSYRDIRDVAFSSEKKFGVHRYQLLMEHWLDVAIEDYYQWMATSGIFVSKYRDLRFNLRQEIKKMASYLGVPDALTAELERKFSLTAQKNRISEITDQTELSGSGDFGTYDPQTLLHTNHIQSGDVGNWQTHPDVGAFVFIQEKYRQWLTDAGYELSPAYEPTQTLDQGALMTFRFLLKMMPTSAQWTSREGAPNTQPEPGKQALDRLQKIVDPSNAAQLACVQSVAQQLAQLSEKLASANERNAVISKRLRSLITPWTWLGWRLMPWTKPSWRHHPLDH